MMTEIRFLTATDATAYWDIQLQPSKSEPDAFGSSPEEHRVLTLDQIALRLTSDPANNFGVDASIGERLISTAGLFRNNGHKQRHKGQIWGVYVAQEAQAKESGGRSCECFRSALPELKVSSRSGLPWRPIKRLRWARIARLALSRSVVSNKH